MVVADTGSSSAPGADDVRYQVLCRAHFRSGRLGVTLIGEQLALG
ncbi:hypothetical protein [Jatrophihabitans lederbergiae]|uniref:Thymidine kinase n=1 Tax=Jatrophihabitans lederbergiae TaxID=3075547 RepID=A0ABU2JDR1_9ACTN|nr:hypothetical protein [Jatrophihabitans sp. DSM 44399]MDT0262873.1 hypothetical protein [Jatrophihabitans sp. DSM 44399]